MATVTRLSLAQQSYEAALRAARHESTARTWAKLLRAAQNLREAIREARRMARGSYTGE
ncbi:MAG TPA: hypothetical protein VMK12_07865 [Anaeromyxobacteraceae bacterium]|nr:hypothetical protein [Anaeromyxobacteraceae bacterium]